MNKNFLEYYMKTKPETNEQKYLFLVDNQDMAFAIISAGYPAVTLLYGQQGYHDIDSFIEYMDEIACTGTYQMDYVYVPACSSKKMNDSLEQYFQNNYLTYCKGWILFKDKEYLAKMEHLLQLKAIISDFIKRFERRSSDQPDLNKFENTPYIYEHGCYHEDVNGICLKSHIQKLLYRDCIKATTIQSIYSLLVSQPQIQKRFSDLNNQPSYWVNFQNGYFDVMEWKLIEHDTKYLMISQIPFSFYPDQAETVLTGGTHIRKYLDFSISDETDQLTFWQYLGYCMTTDTRFQKFLMIKGRGGTGKSIAISFIQHIVGIGNYFSMSLQNLNRRFYPTGLFGKLLNACVDIPSTTMESVDIIKKAVGEDTLLYEKKGQDPTQFNSYAKLLFSANEMPLNLDDKTNAYYRRLLVLDINRTIPEEEKDSKLKEKMCKESDYAIHMAMLALKQLYTNNHFIESDQSKECIAHLYHSADSIKSFTDDMLCHKVGEKIKRSEVYKMYEEYCEDNGRTPHGKSRFWEYMANKGFVIKRFSDGAYYFKDTSVKESDFETMDDMIENLFKQMDLSMS